MALRSPGRRDRVAGADDPGPPTKERSSSARPGCRGRGRWGSGGRVHCSAVSLAFTEGCPAPGRRPVDARQQPRITAIYRPKSHATSTDTPVTTIRRGRVIRQVDRRRPAGPPTVDQSRHHLTGPLGRSFRILGSPAEDQYRVYPVTASLKASEARGFSPLTVPLSLTPRWPAGPAARRGGTGTPSPPAAAPAAPTPPPATT